MIPVNDLAEFEWLYQSLRPTPPAGEVTVETGVELSSIIPLQFERFAKILHRLDGHYENIDRPLSRDEMAILNQPGCEVVRELVVHERRSSPTSRIFWKDAALALGLPYAPEITHIWFSNRLKPYPDCWPRFIYGPADGTLEVRECNELDSALMAVTEEQKCYFRLAEIPYIATEQNLLFTGQLDEVEKFFVKGPLQFTPEYWWPRDRSWCVCSDYDLEFTIDGDCSSLIDSLLRSQVLEYIEVSSGIRVDSLVPIP